MNIIDWIGAGTAPYTDAIKACQFSHNGYVARMKTYFGLGEPACQNKKRNQTKKK